MNKADQAKVVEAALSAAAKSIRPEEAFNAATPILLAANSTIAAVLAEAIGEAVTVGYQAGFTAGIKSIAAAAETATLEVKMQEAVHGDPGA